MDYNISVLLTVIMVDYIVMGCFMEISGPDFKKFLPGCVRGCS
ncbi:hypothetical protein [Maridesulfovibrio bastinii]|nr:hypothetical protein [Maridesulfovibrio bastinii]